MELLRHTDPSHIPKLSQLTYIGLSVNYVLQFVPSHTKLHIPRIHNILYDVLSMFHHKTRKNLFQIFRKCILKTNCNLILICYKVMKQIHLYALTKKLLIHIRNVSSKTRIFK